MKAHQIRTQKFHLFAITNMNENLRIRSGMNEMRCSARNDSRRQNKNSCNHKNFLGRVIVGSWRKDGRIVGVEGGNILGAEKSDDKENNKKRNRIAQIHVSDFARKTLKISQQILFAALVLMYDVRHVL